MYIVNSIKSRYLDYYFRLVPSLLAYKVRHKKRPINFVFVLYDLATWKSEELYIEMLKHPRFNPILAVTTNQNLLGHEQDVIYYLEKKKYSFIILDEKKTIVEQLPVDILLYQRPYNEEPINHQYLNNKSSLIVHLLYGFHSLTESWLVDNIMARRAWQDYFENELSADGVRNYARLNVRNVIVTGTPFMDLLAKPKEEYNDPWKCNDSRKRIIWAPHHTIGSIHMEGIGYGTFLDYATTMIELADEYKERVCFAFKPHPQLYKHLVMLWGQERTEAYYKKWETNENTQIVNGEYLGLFKYSDAMIHDCASFTIEYLAVGNPVMYLVREGRRTDNVDECAKQSYELHYHGKSIDDIRHFIDDVIAGVDSRKEERMKFVYKYLRPPYGRTACENIMNAILGEKEYQSIE